MSHLIPPLLELRALPPSVHILCPRQNDDDQDRYDEDIQGGPLRGEQNDVRTKTITEARERRDKFMSCLQLLAYDGEETEKYQRMIWDTLDNTLGKCDICIRNYYVEKLRFLARLREEYEEPDVQQFFGLIDRRDTARITKGLDAAERVLKSLPEAKRGTAALEPAQLHALFEALLCDAFLQDENLLAQHFDEPFRLIQTKKQLKIREILPSTVRFLFSSNHRRLNWATATWGRLGRAPTDLEWTWSIKSQLQDRLQKATDAASISRFWSGAMIIAKTLPEDLISHKLLDMQPNLCMAALDHLHQPTPAVSFITQTLKIILTKAPKAFWQTMGTISSPTVIEQVFASPRFIKCLNDSAIAENKEEFDVLRWGPALVKSLDLNNQAAACQALATQLFQKLHVLETSQRAKTLCFEVAAQVMMQTTKNFAVHQEKHVSERIVLLDVMKTVNDHISDLLNPHQVGLTGDLGKTARACVLSLVKNGIAIDCYNLRNDFASLKESNTGLKHDPSCYSKPLWDTAVRALDNTDTALSGEVLQGTVALPGLERFRLKAGDPLSKQKGIYNSTFDQVNAAYSRLLGKIADFDPEHLDMLYKQMPTCMHLVAALLSSNDDVYQAAIELIKNISGQGSRKDALAHLIDAFSETTIFSLSWTFRRIATMQTFASVPRMVKSGMEILDVLCSPSDGRLRKQSKIESHDYKPVYKFWSYQWIALRTIFQHMESWSIELHDKPLMTEVCRDTMQYAQDLFEQYHTFARYLTKAKPSAEEDIPRSLLNPSEPELGSPLKVLGSMAKWLRLRDQFLADTQVKLITNMLNQLKMHDVTGDFDGLKYVKDVATTPNIKTILSDTQKATLVRALENYTGQQIAKPLKKKQSTLQMDTWSRSAEKRSSLGRKESSDEYDEIPQVEWANVIKQVKSESSKPAPTKSIPPQQSLPLQKKSDALAAKLAAKKESESKAFIADRKREQELRKQRDREFAAKARGKSTLGEGFGVLGKDHTKPAEPGMMVSSGSESEDSDDALFGKVQRVHPITKTHAHTRQPVAAGPVRKIKQVRSQKDMRARLAPDLTNLHKTILAWDFFADTDLPPNSAKDDYTLVTNEFQSVQDYQKTFEPLLILESWQSFRAAREDGTFKAQELKISNSLLVDSFFELNVTMSYQQGQDLGWGTTDVVILSRSSRPTTDSSEPHCLARIKEVSRKKGEVQIVLRINAAGNPMRPFLNDKATIWASQILSLTTLEREFGALMALPYYDLSEEIIAAKPSRLMDYPDHELATFVQTYDVNEAQARAVKSALDNDAFTLIQGPPGSGKTKTICALVGAAMTGFLPKHNDKGPRLNAASGVVSAPKAAKKILVCAPSNAAVDELVMRFKTGLKLMDGSSEKINVVRLGRSDAINTNVKDVTLDELVNAKLDVGPKDQKEDIHAIMMQHKSVSNEMIELRDGISAKRQKGEAIPVADENALDGLKRKKTSLSNKIDAVREKQNSESRNADLNRKRVQQEILDTAHVLCATLSGSGHEIFQGLNVEFETVIIDEAAQSIELSALIPLKYGCTKCILVGDPKQLPPTVLSREAARFQYEQSLFARMEKNHKKHIHLLDTQYRMHPEISLFPSRTFYDSRLKDGAGMAKLRSRPWHHSPVLAPYRFFDVQGMSQSATKGHSLINIAEIDIAMALYDRLITDVKKYSFRGKVGIITPYKGQLRELKTRFRGRYGEDITSAVEFNTTDAFQGRESEIIIFSCVRASTKGIGFLNDIRRMNVGLTRAKCSLWVLGNTEALNQGEFWRGLISDAKTRQLYTDGNIKALLSRPLLTEDMMKDDIEMVESSTPEPQQPDKPQSVNRNARVDPSNSGTPASSRPASVLSRNSSSSSVAGIIRQEPLRRDSTKALTKSVAAAESGKQISSPSLPPATRPTHMPERRNSNSAFGPSGGRFGLNDLANCVICGSNEHFSFNCNDLAARDSQMGKCKRCWQAGHGILNCNEPRCVGCGEVGHGRDECRAPMQMRLKKDQQDEVILQEERYKKQREKDIAKRAARQLGDHNAIIPEVKSTAPSGEPKRKRDEHEISITGTQKAPRIDGNGVPRGPAVKSAMSSMGGAPPLVRKKKANPDDIFMKRK
ncbi:uncharacterized protein HMPREF1541_05024 [Cyphellophora europaea CBS 101466]|uniref:CCHC-type domain-containing protein n=1 Tax=Cyphellophora europaea (strain CBS 101466) TaxID=1220924 RepID=W2RYI3_CYPE1|nr:uncharacterized protein HMPREF1541_05024 [Cyphellophora europaea CBS 101466]ETN40744.1 hypothetical protein HMPREF1541_05024 [Cyphellophora europaea CBS 101466]